MHQSDSVTQSSHSTIWCSHFVLKRINFHQKNFFINQSQNLVDSFISRFSIRNCTMIEKFLHSLGFKYRKIWLSTDQNISHGFFYFWKSGVPMDFLQKLEKKFKNRKLTHVHFNSTKYWLILAPVRLSFCLAKVIFLETDSIGTILKAQDIEKHHKLT